MSINLTKYGNKQNLLFNITNKVSEYLFDIQFDIDNLILKNIYIDNILNGKCFHPDIKKYPIKNRQLIFYHNCFIEAQKYTNRKDFQFFGKSLYKTAQTNKWLDMICSHMIPGKEKWTLEKLQLLANQCNSRNDFKMKSSSAYHWALRNNYLAELCKHMDFINVNQSDFKRIVYIYKFLNNVIYIGISKDFEKRHRERKYYPNDSVQKYMLETQEEPIIEFLTDYIDSEEAQKLESQYIIEYKNDGYTVLNRNSGGSIGGSYKQN